MDITKVVAKMRFKYHTNMLDVCNVANQIGLLKDNKAEEKGKCKPRKSCKVNIEVSID